MAPTWAGPGSLVLPPFAQSAFIYGGSVSFQVSMTSICTAVDSTEILFYSDVQIWLTRCGHKFILNNRKFYQ